MKQSLPWADGSLVKKELDLRVLELLGPKTADELTGQSGKKKAPPTTNGPAKVVSDKKQSKKPTENDEHPTANGELTEIAGWFINSVNF
jgi:hypothetical protein